MNNNITTLPNGCTIATDKVPNSSSVSVGLWLPVGSGAENPQSNGLCHFYEHLVFKGTKNRSAFKLASEIEDLGGSLNAYTSREVTCFYVKIAKEHLKTAISVLTDLVCNPKLSHADFEKEKSVILEEIRAADDNPEDIVDDLFHKEHFKGSGFALPIAGTIKSVENLELSQIKKHHKMILNDLSIFICVAGNAEHKDVVKYCSEFLPSICHTPSTVPFEIKICDGVQQDKFLKRHFSQSTVVLGAFRQGLSTQEARALQIFNHIFGDGFTSRLFQNIREKYGLVYFINSSLENSLRTIPTEKKDIRKLSSLFQISFATEPANLQKVRDLVQKEMQKFLKNGFSKGELERAKQSIIGSYKLSQDSLSSRQSSLANQILRYGHPIDTAVSEQEILKIQPDFIESFIADFVNNSKWTFAAVVPK
ncbi:peptidase M16 [Fibrobacterales bacterium]|nr:peptidase M16 [Fibrobacterales bacterium]